MSRIRIVQNPVDSKLLSRLVKELNAPEEQVLEGQAVRFDDEIVVIEEPTANGVRYAVTVVWDAWDELESRERGRLIMEAVGAARGNQERNKVSLCMGLTRTEYDLISGRAA